MHNLCKYIACEGIVELHKILSEGWNSKNKPHWLPENIVEIDSVVLLSVTEKICTQCRYPLLALRIFLHILCGIDAKGQIPINARHMAKRLDAHYDTVSKCLKYLREIEVVRIKR